MSAALIAGSYERFVFAFDAVTLAEPPSRRTEAEAAPDTCRPLPKVFSASAHLGPVNCAAAAGGVAATGGADDTIRLFDLRTRRDLGSLTHHQGSVTCVALFTPGGAGAAGAPSHLLSGGDDGALCIWKADGWALQRALGGGAATASKAPPSPLSALAIHPTGRVALTVTRDARLRLWDLAAGRCAYQRRLASGPAAAVSFDPDGGMYALAGVAGVVVFAVDGEAAAPLAVLAHAPSPAVLAMTHVSRGGAAGGLIVTGGAGGALCGWDVRAAGTAAPPAWTIPAAHVTRVRGVTSLPPSPHGGGGPLLASASSDGVVRAWDARMPRPGTPIAENATGARLTCLTACAWSDAGVGRGGGGEGRPRR